MAFRVRVGVDAVWEGFRIRAWGFGIENWGLGFERKVQVALAIRARV